MSPACISCISGEFITIDPPGKLVNLTITSLILIGVIFWKRRVYQTTWPDSWEAYMKVRKQKLELDMEQQTDYK